jgi:hypothetical protein
MTHRRKIRVVERHKLDPSVATRGPAFDNLTAVMKFLDGEVGDRIRGLDHQGAPGEDLLGLRT